MFISRHKSPDLISHYRGCWTRWSAYCYPIIYIEVSATILYCYTIAILISSNYFENIISVLVTLLYSCYLLFLKTHGKHQLGTLLSWNAYVTLLLDHASSGHERQGYCVIYFYPNIFRKGIGKRTHFSYFLIRLIIAFLGQFQLFGKKVLLVNYKMHCTYKQSHTYKYACIHRNIHTNIHTYEQTDMTLKSQHEYGKQKFLNSTRRWDKVIHYDVIKMEQAIISNEHAPGTWKSQSYGIYKIIIPLVVF